jgi:hypothetical protein
MNFDKFNDLSDKFIKNQLERSEQLDNKDFVESVDSEIDKFIARKSEISFHEDILLGIVYDKIKHCPVEDHNGHWDGQRGDSNWYPDPDDVPQKINPDDQTWRDILAKYGIDHIPFRDGEPDFSEICKGEVEIENFSNDRVDNFAQADIKLAKQRNCSPEEVKKWRKDNGYTWHECKDMKTMQKVPSKIHSNIPHSGGILEIRKLKVSNGDNL